ncbi:MAG: cation transporter [Myroides sp.]|jgi:Cu+-exporting ATPase|nr:cation transporter [Myroides sp.]
MINIVKSIAVVMLGAMLFVSCKKEATTAPAGEDVVATTNQSSKEVTGTMEKATFQVEGMTCAIGCAKLIEGKLAAMDGVKLAHVDFDTKTATVEFDDAKQNAQSITTTVEKIANGIYKVENMSSVK